MKKFFTIVMFVTSLMAGFNTSVKADGHMADLVDTAIAADQFNTLATALEAAGLVETLKGQGPFTVFAPTDEAFSKIDQAILQDLLKPENKDKLTEILTYHVVPGKVMSSDIKGDMQPATVNGKIIDVKLTNGKVMINEATVIGVDVAATNGVIHIIDTVLLP